ncbi:MAG TPA: SRPBCC family protein [Candidatus Obscuribacterales bacterium]
MSAVRVEETKLVGADPGKVYAILAQPEHHKNILPDAFVSYEPQPDGTIAFTLKVGGMRRNFHVRVEQTEPNKLMRETDLATGIVTDFRLEPHAEGTLVTIATNYATPRTFAGMLESALAPAFLQQLYEQELTKLCRYALVANVSE